MSKQFKKTKAYKLSSIAMSKIAFAAMEWRGRGMQEDDLKHIIDKELANIQSIIADNKLWDEILIKIQKDGFYNSNL